VNDVRFEAAEETLQELGSTTGSSTPRTGGSPGTAAYRHVLTAEGDRPVGTDWPDLIISLADLWRRRSVT
jgi:hypothetical protein